MYSRRNRIALNHPHYQQQHYGGRNRNHSRAKTEKPKDKDNVNVYKRHINNVQKAIWISSVIVSAALCTWQLGICLQKYFAQPIGTNVRVETFKKYQLPGITVCPITYEVAYDFQPEFTKQCAKNHICKQLSENDRKYYPFSKMNFSLLNLWQPETALTITTHVRCFYAVNDTECLLENSQQKGVVNTVAGSCKTFRTDLQWHYVGKTWVYWIEITNLTDYPIVPFMADFYTSTSISLMFIAKMFLARKVYNDIEITTTQFQYLNTSQNPCFTEEEEIQCINNWTKATFQEPDTKCSWPFMNSTLPPCDTMAEVEKIKQKVLYLQFSQKNFNCNRPCFETKYSLTTTTGKNPYTDYITYVSITLLSNTRQIVSEYFSYPLSSLVSDLGGSIGLFLGISLLSCLKIVLALLDKFY